MHKVQSVNAIFGAMAVALVGAIAVVATPVAASVSTNSGYGTQKTEKPAATIKIADSTYHKLQKPDQQSN